MFVVNDVYLHLIVMWEKFFRGKKYEKGTAFTVRFHWFIVLEVIMMQWIELI